MQIYDTVIKLSLVEHGVLSGISAVVARLMTASGEAKKFEAALGNMKVAAWGVAGAFAGIEALKFASHVEKAGEHLVHVKTMFEAALPAATRLADMTKITSAALKESGDNLRTGLSGNIEAIHDLYNIVGDVGEATKLLPAFNVLKNILDSVADKGSIGDSASKANIAKAVRAFEFMGPADPAHPELLKRTMEEYGRTLVGQRGRVPGGDLFTQTQTAGDAAKGWSDLFATTIFPSLILLGGRRVGFGAYQTFSNLWGGGGGNLSSFTQAMMQEKWGLHTKADEILDEKGKFKGFRAGSVWEASKLRENPLEWANAYRALLQSKYGVNIEDMTSMQLVISDIARNNKNMKSLLDELMLPSSNRQLNKEVATIGKVPNDAAGIIAANDPRAWRQALSVQWETLQEVFGEGYVYPFINNVLKPLTETLSAISRWGSANPGYMKGIADGFVILGAALVGGGGVAVLSALGPAGWIAAGVIATGVAMATYKDPIVSWIHSLTEALGSLVKAFAAEVDWKKLGEDIKKAFDYVTDALGGFSKKIFSIGKMIWDFVSTLGGLLNKTSFGGGGFGGGGIKTSYGGLDDYTGGHRLGSAFGGAGGGSGMPVGKTAAWGGLSPYARGLLDAISGPESGGSYNMLFGGRHFGSYASHPWAGGGAPGGHSDAGRYQFLASTWHRAASALGLHDFSPESQDKAAWWLAQHDYKAATGHNLESDMRSGHFNPAGLASTWVSIAKRTNSWMKRFYEPNVGRALRHNEQPPHLPPSRHRGMMETQVHNIHIDGTKIATYVSKRFVRAAQYATSVGRQDGRGVFMGPGAEQFS